MLKGPFDIDHVRFEYGQWAIIYYYLCLTIIIINVTDFTKNGRNIKSLAANGHLNSSSMKPFIRSNVLAESNRQHPHTNTRDLNTLPIADNNKHLNVLICVLS